MSTTETAPALHANSGDHVNARSLPFRLALVTALPLALATAGCSKQSSSPQTCDNGGVDLIAFASDRGHHGQYDIYLYDADAGGYRLLRNLNSAALNDSSPSLSGDNQLIAFVSPRAATGNGLFVYARLTCSFASLSGIASQDSISSPAFSADGTRLAFVRDTLGHKRIRLVGAGGTSFVPLPGLDSLTASYDDFSPAPDVSGTNLVFVSNRDGQPHLYLYLRAEQRVDSLAGTRGADGIELDPAVTPDLSYVCFASNRSGGRGGLDLYLFNRLTSAYVPLPVANTAMDERHPSINAGGTILAYQSDSSSTRNWRVRYFSVGSASAPLTISRVDTLADDVQPSIVFP